MNWKGALLFFLIFFASAVTVVASLNVSKVASFSISERMLSDAGYEPTGDPIDGPHPPGGESSGDK